MHVDNSTSQWLYGEGGGETSENMQQRCPITAQPVPSYFQLKTNRVFSKSWFND